jgi:voltage-gated potassium channel
MDTPPSRSTKQPMHESFKRIITGTVFFVCALVIAVIGYMMFGWSLLDSLYMLTITIFGIGYGEVNPIDTPEKKLFTMFVIFTCLLSGAYIVGGYLQKLTEGEIKRALEVRRNEKTIESLKEQVIICGFGRIGQVMAFALTEAKVPFIIVDNTLARIAKAESLGYLTCTGSAADEAVLKIAGIGRAKALATVLPDDTMNVFITLTARSLNPTLMLLARGNLPSTESKLRLAGADHVILPTSIVGHQLANLITRPTGLEFVDQIGDRTEINHLLTQIGVQLTELAIASDSGLIGRSLGSAQVTGNGAFVVVGLRKQDGTLSMQLDLNQSLEGGDQVILLGHQGDMPQFANLEDGKRQLHYRGARV